MKLQYYLSYKLTEGSELIFMKMCMFLSRYNHCELRYIDNGKKTAPQDVTDRCDKSKRRTYSLYG